jgi:hypothetical protein
MRLNPVSMGFIDSDFSDYLHVWFGLNLAVTLSYRLGKSSHFRIRMATHKVIRYETIYPIRIEHRFDAGVQALSIYKPSRRRSLTIAWRV